MTRKTTDLISKVVSHFDLGNMTDTQLSLLEVLVLQCMEELSKDSNSQLPKSSQEQLNLVATEEEQELLDFRIARIASYWSNDISDEFKREMREQSYTQFVRGLDKHKNNTFSVLYEFLDTLTYSDGEFTSK